MNVAILFINIGSYHAARLRAAYSAFQQKGWNLAAVQVTDDNLDHPWGNLEREITFPLRTLLSRATTPTSLEEHAACLVPSYLDNLQPDIVAIPGWGFAVSRTALTWCKHHCVPAILMSESKWDDEKRQWWKEQLKSWLYVRRYDTALVGGQLHRDYLIQLGFPRNRIFLGYDAVDNSSFTRGAEAARLAPIAARLRQPGIPSRPFFLVVTRLLKRKNVSRLVEAFADYRQQIKNTQAWDLVICGSGEEEPSVRNLIIEKELSDCVHLPGFISYRAIGDWYGLANAFVHPALQEQWGLVVNEAMAAGLPVLVSKQCGCFKDLVIEGVNGFGFDATNSQELTNLMLKISSEGVDLKKMGQAALEHIQKFSPDYFAQGLIQATEYALSHK